ncbi:chromo domain-containing protein [Caerostris darwini]|uniref:Chromo domain-containing protein n=1 Tax=Caerostris darwini TaxID=1538125 RepID=A0AAV4MGF0_9ARAC|nr:chromo domain-containing protein [Caerostris darwini]
MDLLLLTSRKPSNPYYINLCTTFRSSSPIRFRFAVDDVVRISKARKILKKGYLSGWTGETFKIYKRYPPNPPTYVLQDFSSKEIAGRFYTEEL